MRVKPNPNKKKIKVLDPVHNDFLPTEGREVAPNSYWMRRLQDKDVVEVEVKPATDNNKEDKNNKSANGGKGKKGD